MVMYIEELKNSAYEQIICAPVKIYSRRPNVVSVGRRRVLEGTIYSEGSWIEK